jgi:S-adenosylmethionine/arginine decarboxylase-like enzyme
LSATSVNEFAGEFIKLAGMTSARAGRIDKYPYNNGGGEGFTGFFPLVESYLMIDVYTDINETEILLSTCKPERINVDTLRNYLVCQVGPIKEIGTL